MTSSVAAGAPAAPSPSAFRLSSTRAVEAPVSVTKSPRVGLAADRPMASRLRLLKTSVPELNGMAWLKAPSRSGSAVVSSRLDPACKVTGAAKPLRVEVVETTPEAGVKFKL